MTRAPRPVSAASSDVARLVLEVLPPLTRYLHAELRDRSVVSPERFRVLRALERGPMRIGAIATRARLSPAAMTRLGDGLVADRLVVRVEDQADRRSVRLALTDTGRTELARGEAIVVDALERLLAPLGAAEHARLVLALGDLRTVLEPEGSPGTATIPSIAAADPAG